MQAVQGHPEEVYACEFLDQSHLLTASADRLFLWDLDMGTCLQEATCTPGPHDQGDLNEQTYPYAKLTSRAKFDITCHW